VRTYTANELQDLVDLAYARGLADGKNLAPDVRTTPPLLVELIDHPLDGGPKRSSGSCELP